MKLSDERIDAIMGLANPRLAANCEIESALTELQLRREMDRYVIHHAGCELQTCCRNGQILWVSSDRKCTCGLDALKKQLEDL